MSLPTQKAWDKIGSGPQHGIQVSLLSLHSEMSCGNGEFYDLIPLIDFLSSIGMTVLQLLPLNDSGYDPSPYNAKSATALHPIYLSLEKLPFISPPLSTFKSYNKTKHVPYLQVLDKKIQFLRKYVNAHRERITNDPSYQVFIESHPQLIDYALYKTLKQKHNHLKWQKWPEEEQRYSKQKRKAFLEEAQDEITFYLILQYLCHCQLSAVKDYSEKKGVFLMGDLPILLSPDSADVWSHQEFFDLTQVAGSPPNPFDPKGQNWKFPLYNWTAMEENGFDWWRQKITAASSYYHLYRLDHVRGFFRIWAIPLGKGAEEGQFLPSDPALMEAQGRKILSTLVTFSEMLPIAEDLGEPFPCVGATLEALGIPGTRIFQRYRNWKTDGSFVPYTAYPPLSAASVSTHDLPNLSLWWKAFPDEAKAYANQKGWEYFPQLPLEHRKTILWENHHTPSIFHINLLQEFLALAPELTWESPEDEQINIPGTESSRNWTYRTKPSLENLRDHPHLRSTIKGCIK